MMDYVSGRRPRLGTKWEGAHALAFPLNLEQQHWIAVYVNLQEANIKVMDSNIYTYKDDHLKSFIEPLSIMIPKLLKQSKLFEHLGSKLDDVWPFERLRELVQNENG